MTSSDAPEIHTYIEISLEHLKFQAVLHGPWPRRHCNCVGSNFLCFFQWHFVTRRFVEVSYIHNLGFRILGYTTNIECNGEARRQPAKNAWNFAMEWFPICGTLRRLISLQIERRNQTWSTFYSLDSENAIEPLDSENAIEPCISAFTDCLSWWTLDWVVALLVQVCDKICPVCQLSPLPKSGCPNERWRRLNIKCQHVSTFCSLSCEPFSVLYSLASKFDPWVYSLFLRRMRPLGGWKSVLKCCDFVFVCMFVVRKDLEQTLQPQVHQASMLPVAMM